MCFQSTKVFRNDCQVIPEAWEAHFRGRDLFEQLYALEGRVYREQGGRKTLRFTLDGKGYFAKLNRGIGWKEILKNLIQLRLPVTGMQNEWRAIRRLGELKIETLKVVGYGKRGRNPARLQSFVITEELTNTLSLENFCRDWPMSPPSLAHKRSLIRETAEIARTLHEHGMNHRDLYLCHLLLDVSQEAKGIDPQGLRLYLVDLHRAQIRRRTPRRWRVKDIAGLYFSSMDIGLTKRDLFQFIRVYGGKSLRASLEKDRPFWKGVRRRGNRLYRKIHERGPHIALKKLFCESQDLIRRKDFRRFMLCKRTHYTPSMEAFLGSPDRVVDAAQAVPLKKGRGSTVARVRIDDRDLVVKRYNIKGFWHGLSRSIRTTRAAHSWRNAHHLLMLHIHTPRPVAMLEKRFGPLRSTAYFINEYVEGPRAVDFFEGGDLHGKREVARRMADILKKLGAGRVSHGDMKATNFIIHKEGPALVDLDAMRHHADPRRFATRHQKDLKRFFKNWRDIPEVGDLFRELVN